MTKKILSIVLFVLLLIPGLALAYSYTPPTYGSDGSYKSAKTTQGGGNYGYKYTSATYSRSASGVTKYTPESFSYTGGFPKSPSFNYKEPKQNSYNNNQYPAMKKYRY